MNLDPIRPYLGLVKIGAAVVALIAAVWWWNGFIDRQQEIGYDKAAAEYQVKLDEQKKAALEEGRRWDAKLKGAIDERTEVEKRLAAARDAAADADDRLRRTTTDFRQRLSAASVEACRSAAETAAGLLGDCSARYRAVAAAAAGHAADVQQCEIAWPG